jgi:hypothetical protein
MRGVLYAAQIRSMMIEVTAHVCGLKSSVPNDTLPHGDVHGVIQHLMFRREEGSFSQNRHVHACGLQWQLQIPGVRLRIA